MRIFFMIIVALHGLIHLMGFFKAFELAEIKELTQPISRPFGILWLLAAVLFIITIVMYLGKNPGWWMAASSAVLLSQILIFSTWTDAKFGTLANILVLIVGVVAFGNWSIEKMAENEVNTLLPTSVASLEPLAEQYLAGVPPIVKTWLQKSGVLGQETIQTVHLKQRGEMQLQPDSKWMPFTADQWFNTANPGFVWLADVNAAPGFFFRGRDKYNDGRGHMLIKLLALVPVVDDRGDKLDQGTMLRYLAEMVWYPSAAVADYVTWEEIDATSARATMTLNGDSVSGVFTFFPNGDPKSFEAQRYYGGGEDARLETWFIDVEPDGFFESQGIRIPGRSTVIWKLDEGDHPWLKLEITEIDFNRAVAPVQF